MFFKFEIAKSVLEMFLNFEKHLHIFEVFIKDSHMFYDFA